MSKPVLAVTLGDVAGIGPEITARTLLGHPHLRERCVPVVIGDEADADSMQSGIGLVWRALLLWLLMLLLLGLAGLTGL